MPRSYPANRHVRLFGEIIRRLRQERGWTAVQLGRKAGMNPTYIGYLERGCNIPTLKTVITLSEVLQTNAADVLREVLDRANPPRPRTPPSPNTIAAVRKFALTRKRRRQRA